METMDVDLKMRYNIFIYIYMYICYIQYTVLYTHIISIYSHVGYDRMIHNEDMSNGISPSNYHPNVWICPPNCHCGMVNVVLNHINFGGTYSQTNPDFDFGHFNASISSFFRGTMFLLPSNIRAYKKFLIHPSLGTKHGYQKTTK